MYQKMPQHNQDIPLFNFQNHTPTYTSHDAHLHYSGISFFCAQWVLRRTYPEWSVLGQIQFLSRCSAEERWEIAGCSFFIHTEVSFINCSRISSAMPPHIRKAKQQLCNHYYVLNYSAYGSV